MTIALVDIYVLRCLFHGYVTPAANLSEHNDKFTYLHHRTRIPVITVRSGINALRGKSFNV